MCARCSQEGAKVLVEVFACEDEQRMLDAEVEASERTILDHDNNYRCCILILQAGRCRCSRKRHAEAGRYRGLQNNACPVALSLDLNSCSLAREWMRQWAESDGIKFDEAASINRCASINIQWLH